MPGDGGARGDFALSRGGGGSHGYICNTVWLILPCSHQPPSLLAKSMLHRQCCAVSSAGSGGPGMKSWRQGPGSYSRGWHWDLGPLNGLCFLSCRKWREGARHGGRCSSKTTHGSVSCFRIIISPAEKIRTWAFNSRNSDSGWVLESVYTRTPCLHIKCDLKPLWEALDDF